MQFLLSAYVIACACICIYVCVCVSSSTWSGRYNCNINRCTLCPLPAFLYFIATDKPVTWTLPETRPCIYAQLKKKTKYMCIYIYILNSLLLSVNNWMCTKFLFDITLDIITLDRCIRLHLNSYIQNFTRLYRLY